MINFRDFTADQKHNFNVEAERCADITRRSRNDLTFCGLSAVRLLGITEPKYKRKMDTAVQVCVHKPGQRTRLTGVHFIMWTLPFNTESIQFGEDVIEVVDPVTAAAQLLRYVEKEEAVVLFDALLCRNARNREQTLNDLHELLHVAQRFPGKLKGQWALQYTREGTDSAMESRLRLKLVTNGFQCPVVNHQIVHPQTREIWFADLAYPELRIAIEYQGFDFHSSRASLAHDSRKVTALQGTDWNVLPVTYEEISSEMAWNRFVDTLTTLMRARNASENYFVA
ncbi:hypothetical protein [Bifidobacterium aquikefiri]|uniref:hypothetical protein n=2 Tax=Bifidobacterium aquikefiri TaxID=1653207 RepID=UPI0039EB2498